MLLLAFCWPVTHHQQKTISNPTLFKVRISVAIASFPSPFAFLFLQNQKFTEILNSYCIHTYLHKSTLLPSPLFFSFSHHYSREK